MLIFTESVVFMEATLHFVNFLLHNGFYVYIYYLNDILGGMTCADL